MGPVIGVDHRGSPVYSHFQRLKKEAFFFKND